MKKSSDVGHIRNAVILSLDKGFNLLVGKAILVPLRLGGIVRALNAGWPFNQKFHALVGDSLIQEFIRDDLESELLIKCYA